MGAICGLPEIIESQNQLVLSLFFSGPEIAVLRRFDRQTSCIHLPRCRIRDFDHPCDALDYFVVVGVSDPIVSGLCTGVFLVFRGARDERVFKFGITVRRGGVRDLHLQDRGHPVVELEPIGITIELAQSVYERSVHIAGFVS